MKVFITITFLFFTFLFSNIYGYNCIHNKIASEVKIVSVPQNYEFQIAKASGQERAKLLSTAEYSPIRIKFHTDYIMNDEDQRSCYTLGAVILFYFKLIISL